MTSPRQQKWRQAIADTFINQMPFNQLLGIELVDYSATGVKLKLPMDPKLVGNPIHGILHGGATATILDVAGGMTAAAAAVKRLENLSSKELSARISKTGTIDLRIDYLRPGIGEVFYATAEIIRSGNKVTVARMELHNQEGTHIAFGTGTYLVG
ncbi:MULTISPECIES: thioesterase family protein [Agarivorans]|uniref:Medium/long-chain acyl-CoA thioesterase YigI n=1 Tax=Agarivorans aestuarii TaxID=1563703 RepID=A0ABU7G977_9ALTE|nr:MULTISPECIES: thioesterase family protein [Agarivorans]MEE1675963.1 thioesterase family protein [Agarivorans aestuarii]